MTYEIRDDPDDLPIPRLRLTSQRGKPRYMILMRFTQTPPVGSFVRRLRRRGRVGKSAALQDGFDHSSLTSLRSKGAVPLVICKPVTQRWPRVDKSGLGAIQSSPKAD